MDGVHLTVRGQAYPVTPDNAATACRSAKLFKDAGLVVGLVSIDTDVNDPDSKTARAVFDACARAEAPAVKIGYFAYKPPFDDALKDARSRLAGFAKLAEQTKVRVCCHTHSGANLGNNFAGLRMLLSRTSTRTTSAPSWTPATRPSTAGRSVWSWTWCGCGCRCWPSRTCFGRKATKRLAVPRRAGRRRHRALERRGPGRVKDRKFNGTISLHAEYETKDMAERKAPAKRELDFLKKLLA